MATVNLTNDLYVISIAIFMFFMRFHSNGQTRFKDQHKEKIVTLDKKNRFKNTGATESSF